MSGRDHSETCEVCGFERGGMNDQLCACETEEAKDAYRARLVCPECHCLADHDSTCSRNPLAQLRSDLARVTAERDEAAAERDTYRTERDEALSNGLGWQDRWAHDTAQLEMERDALRARLAKYERVVAAATEYARCRKAAHPVTDEHREAARHALFDALDGKDAT